MTKEQFESLSNKEKKILIAKDIIESVEKGFYIPLEGNYVVMETTLKGDIKDNIDNIKNCEVCNLGACLMSITKFANKLQFEDLSISWNTPSYPGSTTYLGWESTSRSKIKELLTSVFSSRELAILEAIFEEASHSYSIYNLDYTLSGEDGEVCERIYNKFDSAKERMLYTMNNIIENEGELVI